MTYDNDLVLEKYREAQGLDYLVFDLVNEILDGMDEVAQDMETLSHNLLIEYKEVVSNTVLNPEES